MLLKILCGLFILSGLVFILAIVINQLWISKLKNPMLSSHFVAGITASIAFYVITAFCTAIFAPGIISKSIMVLFAVSPFIIGKFATYDKKVLFTALQFLCILLSDIVVLFYIL